MADITKDDVIEFIANMTVLELSEMVKELEDKFGVSAAAPVAMMAAGRCGDAGAAAGREEKTEFDVILTGCRRQEDPGHQGSPGHHRTGPERRQGAGG
jgi:large subunit ribosomal protein L7/L12